MPMRLDRLRIMVLVPDADTRATLRDALAAVIFKGEVTTLRRLEEASRILRTDSEYHAIFIASAFGTEMVKEFVSGLAGLPKPPDVAMVLTVDRHTANKLGSVIQSYMSGVDGFISEPYSSEQLRELLEKVLDPARERKVQASVRAIKSTELLALDATGHIDRMWQHRLAGGQGGGAGLGDLKKIQPSLSEIQQKHPIEFVEGLCRVFEAVKPPEASELTQRRKTRTEQAQHPGAIIQQLMLQRGLSKERLLPLIRVAPEDFDRLIAQQIALTDVVARELARALGKTAREWMALQRAFESTRPDKKEAYQEAAEK